MGLFSLLLARSIQSRNLRASDGAISNLQRSRSRPDLCWREHHADRARGLGGETCRTVRCRNAVVSRRRNRDAGQRHGLQIGEREYLRGTRHTDLRLREQESSRSEFRLHSASAQKAHSLRAARCIVGKRQGPVTRPNCGRRKCNLEDAVLSRSQSAAAGLGAGRKTVVAARRYAADIQR
jgi:hypothetical protein